jgi:hypothetical protein
MTFNKPIHPTLYHAYDERSLSQFLLLRGVATLLLIPVLIGIPLSPSFGLEQGQSAPMLLRAMILGFGVAVLLLLLVILDAFQRMHKGAKNRDERRFRQGLLRAHQLYRMLYLMHWFVLPGAILGTWYLFGLSILDAIELLVWGGIVFGISHPFLNRSLVYLRQWIRAMEEDEYETWIAPRPERLRIFTLLFLFGHFLMLFLLVRWGYIADRRLLVLLVLLYWVVASLGQLRYRVFLKQITDSMREAKRLVKERHLNQQMY